MTPEVGNFPPPPDAATVRANKLRAKGKAVDFDERVRMEPDTGATNILE